MAWMNFNYEKLRKLTSDELYNTYESQLKVLKAKKQQNIMSDITLEGCNITTATRKNNKEIIKATLSIGMYDYVINEEGKVVRGNKNKKIHIVYEITLTKNIEILDKCPSCGAKITNINSGKCDYCNAVIMNNNKEYVMSKKRALRQR